MSRDPGTHHWPTHTGSGPVCATTKVRGTFVPQHPLLSLTDGDVH